MLLYIEYIWVNIAGVYNVLVDDDPRLCLFFNLLFPVVFRPHMIRLNSRVFLFVGFFVWWMELLYELVISAPSRADMSSFIILQGCVYVWRLRGGGACVSERSVCVSVCVRVRCCATGDLISRLRRASSAVSLQADLMRPHVPAQTCSRAWVAALSGKALGRFIPRRLTVWALNTRPVCLHQRLDQGWPVKHCPCRMKLVDKEDKKWTFSLRGG